jgi:hypothetical protein
MADDFYVNGRSVFYAGSSGKAMASDVTDCARRTHGQ